MRLRLQPGVLTSYNPDTGMGYALVKVIDEDDMLIDIDASPSSAVEQAKPGQRWLMNSIIKPAYLRGSIVEIVEILNRGGYDYKVEMIEPKHPMPRNAQFSRTFHVRRSHLASRA